MKKAYEDAGERIKELRLMKGYTRDELAEKAEISSKFLYEVESGRKGFSVGVLYGLAQALDVSCDYVLTGETSKDRGGQILKVLSLLVEGRADNLEDLLRLADKPNQKECWK